MYGIGKEIFPRFPSCSIFFNCFIREGTVTGVNLTTTSYTFNQFSHTADWPSKAGKQICVTSEPVPGSTLSAPLSRQGGALTSGI